jgi:hypothetical protein
MLATPPEAIIGALDVLEQAGGAGAWLLGHGLSSLHLAELRDRLVEGE